MMNIHTLLKIQNIDITDVALCQQQLTLDQCSNLHEVLSKLPKLFEGPLGVYPHQKLHIDLKPGAQWVKNPASSVPLLHRQTFK